MSEDYGDVRPEYLRPPRSDAAYQEFGVPLHEIHPAPEMNDHNLLREMLKGVLPGLEGEVLSSNCEHAESEGDPEELATFSRLYALWERQGTESREDLSCDTEHAESEEEEQEEEDNEIARRSIVERLFKNVSWDTIDEDARANLYYHARDSGLVPQRRRGRSPIRPRPIFNDLGPVALPRIGKKERFSKPCPRHREAGRRAGPHQYLSKPFHCGCCVGTCELCDPTKDPWSPSYAMLE